MQPCFQNGLSSEIVLEALPNCCMLVPAQNAIIRPLKVDIQKASERINENIHRKISTEQRLSKIGSLSSNFVTAVSTTCQLLNGTILNKNMEKWHPCIFRDWEYPNYCQELLKMLQPLPISRSSHLRRTSAVMSPVDFESPEVCPTYLNVFCTGPEACDGW